jgi:hypothetical protein
MAERLAWRLAPALLAAVCLSAVAAAPPARACDSTNQHQFGIAPGCFDVRVAGPPTAADVAPGYFQAGGHPYTVTTAIRLNAPAGKDPTHGEYWPAEPLRDISLTLPPGLVADPAVVPPCSTEQLVGSSGYPTCSPDSQVGALTTYVPALGGGLKRLQLPLFRVSAPADIPARFGFNSGASPSTFDARTVPGGGGALSIDLRQMNGILGLSGVEVELWGVPADPGHTPERACPGQVPPAGAFTMEPGPSCAATLPERAFLRLPTACTGPAQFSAQVDSWLHPGEFQSIGAVTHLPPGLLGDPSAGAGYPAPFPGLTAAQWGGPQGFQGCGQLPFDPSIAVRPSSHAAGSPTGLEIEVSLPQPGIDDPGMLGEADLREAVAKLPAGLSLNASLANGLSACGAAQMGLDSNLAPTCPDSSKLGTVEIASPLLEGSLTGSIYIAERAPGTGGAALPIYLVAGSGELVVKLSATLAVDPASGRLSAILSDGPQIPIDRLRMHFFDGDRAPFVNPPACGSYATQARLTPWSGTEAVAASDSFAISAGLGGGPCPGDRRPFDPGFSAGVSNALAGGAAALTVKLSRRDGEQEPASLAMTLPSGLVASPRGVPTCPDAAIAAAEGRDGVAELAAPSCPPAARIGDASLTVGAGSEPFRMQTGKIYLAGPYRGAAFSFAVVVPAVAGPIDLGTMAMRAPLRVDPANGHLTIESSFPSAPPGGVPLNLRQIVLDLDRPGFLTNPTSCRAASIGGQVEGDGGTRASVSSPFRLQGCAGLGFEPRLRASVLGRPAAAAHTAHPAIRFALSARRGDANIRRATIALPGSEQLDPAHIRGVCSSDQFAAGECPDDSVYGHARVVSPLFGKPLTGPVYMRASSGKLPSLVAALRGQLDLDLEAKVGFAGGHLRIVIPSLPDVPVSKLVLTTSGGRRGLFVNNRDICAEPAFSAADLIAQNGKRAHRQAKLNVPCRG